MKKYEGYLFVYFTGESEDGEQIYFAVSSDGLHWNDLKVVSRFCAHMSEKRESEIRLLSDP